MAAVIISEEGAILETICSSVLNIYVWQDFESMQLALI
jgi:hypothetical protein